MSKDKSEGKKRKKNQNMKAFGGGKQFMQINFKAMKILGREEACYLGYLIDQLDYWQDEHGKYLSGGYFPVTKSDILKYIGQKRKIQDRVREKLEALGLIDCKRGQKREGGTPIFYKVDMERIKELLKSDIPAIPKSPKGTNGKAQKGLMEKSKRDFSKSPKGTFPIKNNTINQHHSINSSSYLEEPTEEGEPCPPDGGQSSALPFSHNSTGMIEGNNPSESIDKNFNEIDKAVKSISENSDQRQSPSGQSENINGSEKEVTPAGEAQQSDSGPSASDDFDIEAEINRACSASDSDDSDDFDEMLADALNIDISDIQNSRWGEWQTGTPVNAAQTP